MTVDQCYGFTADKDLVQIFLIYFQILKYNIGTIGIWTIGNYLLSIQMFYLYREGGVFKAHLTFPREYPQKPPKMQFISDMWHPNSKYIIEIWQLHTKRLAV
jgi:hypothetical protein